MKTMNRRLLAALVLAAATVPAFAQYRPQWDAIDQRQYRLEQRIEEGRRSGELTRHEYGRLRNELALIARDERIYRSDGFVSPREWQALNARLDALSQQVRYERRDAERRGPSYSGPVYNGPGYYGGPNYNDYRADRRY